MTVFSLYDDDHDELGKDENFIDVLFFDKSCKVYCFRVKVYLIILLFGVIVIEPGPHLLKHVLVDLLELLLLQCLRFFDFRQDILWELLKVGRGYFLQNHVQSA